MFRQIMEVETISNRCTLLCCPSSVLHFPREDCSAFVPILEPSCLCCGSKLMCEDAEFCILWFYYVTERTAQFAIQALLLLWWMGYERLYRAQWFWSYTRCVRWCCSLLFWLWWKFHDVVPKLELGPGWSDQNFSVLATPKLNYPSKICR